MFIKKQLYKVTSLFSRISAIVLFLYVHYLAWNLVSDGLIYAFIYGSKVIDPEHADEIAQLIPKIDTPVFLLHGLGERTWTMQLFVTFLHIRGWTNVYTPHWPANTCQLEDCLDALDKEMQLYANKSQPILVVGNSMGGVMAHHLHTRNWNILVSYSIAAPLKGAQLYRHLKKILPTMIFDFFHQPGHDYLERTEAPPNPPHTWYTVSFNTLYDFDGQVHLLDTLIYKRQHITMTGFHFSLALDPAVWKFLELHLRSRLVSN